MGTSGISKGPGSGTPLVPTWLNEPTTAAGSPADGSPSASDPATGDGNSQNDQSDQSGAGSPLNAQSPPAPGRFQSARRNFTASVKSGGADGPALRRAIRDYVRSGAGGSRNATRRMGASRNAGTRMLDAFRGFQRDGVEATLSRLNLAHLVGRPVEDVFTGLTDVICQDGGSIDEAVARDAWLETVAEISELGIVDLNTLTLDQMREVFLTFIGHAIETRLFQDIGTRGFQSAIDARTLNAFQEGLTDYIQRTVRDAFHASLNFGSIPNLSDEGIREVVDTTYREAWALFETLGDIEG